MSDREGTVRHTNLLIPAHHTPKFEAKLKSKQVTIDCVEKKANKNVSSYSLLYRHNAKGLFYYSRA